MNERPAQAGWRMAILTLIRAIGGKRQIRYLWSERPKMLQCMDDENKVGFEKIHRFALIALGAVTSLFFFYKILFG